MQEEGVYVAVWRFEVLKDSPSVCDGATTNAPKFANRPKKPCLILWLNIVFNRDKGRARIGDSRILNRRNGPPPVNPRREVNRQVRQLEQQPQCCGGHCSAAGPHQRRLATRPCCQRPP